jgi:hypothetical protein
VKDATLQIDENVKIPAAVRAAAARSEELFNSLRDQPAEGTAEEVTPEGNPELDAASLAQSEPAQVQPTEKPTEQPATEPATPSPKAEGDESWEHKYKSMHGRFLRSQEQVRLLSEQVSNLQGVIATMQVAPAQQTTLPELDAEKLITPEEAADYGEDFLKVVGKRAREEVAPLIKGYQAKIAELEQKLNGVSGAVQQSSQEKLLAKLDEEMPQWRELNTNKDFLEWLHLPDTYSGAIRHDMLKAAYAQGNPSRVLAFFKGFLAEEAALAPAQAEPDPKATTVAKVPLANLAAPGRAKTAASAPAPAEKPIITRAQIASFYADIANGKYRGRDAEKARAETMIFEAQRDGRIR